MKMARRSFESVATSTLEQSINRSTGGGKIEPYLRASTGKTGRHFTIGRACRTLDMWSEYFTTLLTLAEAASSSAIHYDGDCQAEITLISSRCCEITNATGTAVLRYCHDSCGCAKSSALPFRSPTGVKAAAMTFTQSHSTIQQGKVG